MSLNTHVLLWRLWRFQLPIYVQWASGGPEGSATSGGFLDKLLPIRSIRTRECYLATPTTSRATPPATMKNTTDIQACGSGSLLVASATTIVRAAIPDMNAIAMQHCGKVSSIEGRD